MLEAIHEAEIAMANGEIPVGAVVVRDGKIIGRGRNDRRNGMSPLAHAEIAAIEDAGKTIGAWRFDGCSIFVTLEPCPMCAGAISETRFARVVFGARDPRRGACGSLYSIPNDPRLPHRCNVIAGVLEAECAKLLRDFFAQRRKS